MVRSGKVFCRVGNIADVSMFPRCWLVLPRAQHVWRTQKCFWKSSGTFPVSARRATIISCHVLPRTSTILRHNNVAPTTCPRFARALKRQCGTESYRIKNNQIVISQPKIAAQRAKQQFLFYKEQKSGFAWLRHLQFDQASRTCNHNALQHILFGGSIMNECVINWGLRSRKKYLLRYR